MTKCSTGALRTIEAAGQSGDASSDAGTHGQEGQGTMTPKAPVVDPSSNGLPIDTRSSSIFGAFLSWSDLTLVIPRSAMP